MNQADIVAAVTAGQGQFTWVSLTHDIEVMAWPLRIDGVLVGVSARTAAACAAALSSDEWVVSLTTPKVEDMIYASAALRPEPVLLNPQKIDIASDAAISENSQKLLALIGATSDSVLVACGKSWVQTNKLLQHPGRAANYGLFSVGAPFRSENGAYSLWQPLSFAHNLDHFDYSQLLRLVRRKPGTMLPSYEVPASDATSTVPADSSPTLSETQASTSIAQGTLGERCLTWCLTEALAHAHPDADRVAWYHAVAIRNGMPLGIKTGNYCASAQSRALVECLLPGDAAPHEPRAAVVELQSDAVGRGQWRSAAEVRANKWLPRPGDLAIYDRSNPADPSTSWQRHVNRLVRVSDDNTQYEHIGANEIGGSWAREWTRFSNAALIGFIVYPGVPSTEAELATVELTQGAVG
jgi:hypothetical protein